MLTFTLQRDDGSTLELDLAFTICRAEPDVGIMTDYVDDWYIEGDKDHSLFNSLSEAEKDQIDNFFLNRR